MPEQDALRWNDRYLKRLGQGWDESPRPFLIENARFLPASGLALDIATGLGGNAHFLMSKGLRVVAVDISWVAVQASKARYPPLRGVVADLTQFYLPDATFDVVLNFYYLQRDLWPDFERALRPGGLLFFETMTDRMLAVNPTINPLHVLAAGELATAFPNLETIVYQEDVSEAEPNKIFTARLIARKPA